MATPSYPCIRAHDTLLLQSLQTQISRFCKRNAIEVFRPKCSLFHSATQGLVEAGKDLAKIRDFRAALAPALGIDDEIFALLACRAMRRSDDAS